MYLGWAAFAGTEIWNAVRTKTYVDAFLPTADFKDYDPCPNLSVALGDSPYSNPVTDNVDWFDPYVPHSSEFYGFYPVTVEGMEDSTHQTSVTELFTDGGILNRGRNASRIVRITGLLVAANAKALYAGKTWFRTALRGNECSDGVNGCLGDDFCFLTGCPDECQPSAADVLYRYVSEYNADVPYRGAEPTVEACADVYLRTLHHVGVIDGPRVIEEFDLTCGGKMSRVEFTIQAGRPYLYGQPQLVARGGTIGGEIGLPDAAVFLDLEPMECEVRNPWTWGPTSIIDPSCPPLPVPPRPPVIPEACGPVGDEVYVSPVDVRVLDDQQEAFLASRGWFTRPGNDLLLYEPPRTGPVRIQEVGEEAYAWLITQGWTDPPGGGVMIYPPNGWQPPETSVTYSSTHAIFVPGAALPSWTDAVPIIRLTAPSTDIRQGRIRFYPAPINQEYEDLDPCGFCGEFVVSYIPRNSTLVIDGTRETATMIFPGGSEQNAAHLLYGSDGNTFTWPVLTCGTSYYCVIDTGPTAKNMREMSLLIATRE